MVGYRRIYGNHIEWKSGEGYEKRCYVKKSAVVPVRCDKKNDFGIRSSGGGKNRNSGFFILRVEKRGVPKWVPGAAYKEKLGPIVM